ISHNAPLTERKIGARGVVAAGMQQHDVSARNTLKRSRHGVEIEGMIFPVVISVSLNRQPRSPKYRFVIGPRHIGYPDRGLFVRATNKIAGDSQGAGPANGLNGGDALVFQNNAALAKNQLFERASK